MSIKVTESITQIEVVESAPSEVRVGYSDAQIQALIDDNYIPIASVDDINAIRTAYEGASTRNFAEGTIWETGEINTTGTLDKYVQIQNVDLYSATRLGGDYYDSGEGWDPIGLYFSGTYDGGGYILNGMYINRTSDFVGLFRYVLDGAVVRNISMLNVEIIASGSYVGAISGMARGTVSTIEKCLVHGAITHTGPNRVGGILGGRHTAYDNHVIIENCFSAVDINSTGEYVGGISGNISEPESWVKNCVYVGKLYGDETAGKTSALVGFLEQNATIMFSYYNQETTIFSDDLTGAKTASELLTGTASDSIYVDWGREWRFQNNRYPVPSLMHRQVGVNSPPLSLSTSINNDDDIACAWLASNDGLSGYNLYIDGVKVNASLITSLAEAYTPADSGGYRIYLKAVFENEGFTWETGPCNLVDESYYLPALARVSGNDVIIADKRDEDNSDHYTTISLPVAKEFSGSESSIALTDSSFTAGEQVGIWYGTGTEIYREFEDAKRLITQTITVYARRIKIANNVEYKQPVNIDYEGFALTGHVAYGRNRNVFGSGSGQNIIDNTGIWFHNGNYTLHRVLADINIDFAYKEYAQYDEENCTLYLMDGRDNIPCRVLFQPNGYNSSFTISNHADGATLERQRTVFFGASNAGDPEYGTKGMALHAIVSDWSAFAKDEGGDATAFENYPEYLAFLESLVPIGNQVIPHSTASGSDHRVDAIEFLPQYESNFGSKNWIDHSLAGGDITLGISSKGWDISDADEYMMDEFEDLGFSQAWAYIDYTLDRILESIWGFNHDIAYFNDHLVMPSDAQVLIWKSSNRPIFNETLNFSNLINDCGCIDAHEYIGGSSREGSGDSYGSKYTHYDDNGTLRITTGFELFLQDLSTRKAAGEIWNPTCTEWNEYFIKLKDVEVDYADADTLSIENSGSSINGFSILINKKDITPTLNGQAMSRKDVDLGTICWGNLNAGSNTINF